LPLTGESQGCWHLDRQDLPVDDRPGMGHTKSVAPEQLEIRTQLGLSVDFGLEQLVTQGSRRQRAASADAECFVLCGNRGRCPVEP
jgi:hypothetical protein